MKRILFLLLLISSATYGQCITPPKILPDPSLQYYNNVLPQPGLITASHPILDMNNRSNNNLIIYVVVQKQDKDNSNVIVQPGNYNLPLLDNLPAPPLINYNSGYTDYNNTWTNIPIVISISGPPVENNY